MTDPKVQYQVGTITALVNDGTLTSSDVTVLWSDGRETKEIDCELYEVKAENGVWKRDIPSKRDKRIAANAKYYHDV
tara:strand:+ start:378 stop:608 length:231 start_codon:yes stop_codon:yes gene_type:complete